MLGFKAGGLHKSEGKKLLFLLRSRSKRRRIAVRSGKLLVKTLNYFII